MTNIPDWWPENPYEETYNKLSEEEKHLKSGLMPDIVSAHWGAQIMSTRIFDKLEEMSILDDHKKDEHKTSKQDDNSSISACGDWNAWIQLMFYFDLEYSQGDITPETHDKMTRLLMHFKPYIKIKYEDK